MTPKEKAEELCYLYQGDFEKDTLNMNWTMAKKCALIAVDELIKCTPSVERYPPSIQTIHPKVKEYWIEVRNEIEKL